MTRNAWVAGLCALRASPLEKHETQRSNSLQAGSAHRMRTYIDIITTVRTASFDIGNNSRSFAGLPGHVR